MKKKFSQGFLFLCFFQILTVTCFSQNLKAVIEIPESDPSKLLVKASIAGETAERNLLFLLNYADSENLGLRITDLSLHNSAGQQIDYKKLSAGTYAAVRPFSSFSYRVDVSVPQNILSTAHISWIFDKKGILKLNDLLPVFETRYKTTAAIKLPDGWKISTAEKALGENTFSVNKTESALFAIGKGWKAKTFEVSDTNVNLVFDEKWNVDISSVEEITKDILHKYENYFGAIPEKNLHILNFKLPETAGFDRWRAEAKGSNIVVMTAPTVFENQLRQRIQEQLRHELFHVWMPNNLALDGDYAWFYEGFAQYAALRAGVDLNHITFGDFLNTLEQAHNFGNRRSQPISLLEASKKRWFAENSSVYAKGLAVAFLFDAALLRQSGGKNDLISVMRQIFEKHKLPNKTKDANEVILGYLGNRPELSPIIEDYVTGAERLNFENHLGQTGIEILPDGSRIKLQVKARLNRREKDFLDKLGYNNWRKFLSK